MASTEILVSRDNLAAYSVLRNPEFAEELTQDSTVRKRFQRLLHLGKKQPINPTPPPPSSGPDWNGTKH